MSRVDDALVEIQETLDVLAPQMEGLKDFARLNLQPGTREVVNAAIQVYERRITLLTDSRVMLQRVATDGHPEMAIREVDFSALEDLRANAATIEAALSTFTKRVVATGMDLSAGETQHK